MVDHDLFVQWAESHFDNVKVHGNEVKLNDVWWKDDFGNTDTGNHCWVNTEKGCFRAFKSEQTGSIFEFIMQVDGCSWDEAKGVLGSNSLYNLEKKVAEFLRKKKPALEIKTKGSLDLPEKTFLLRSLEQNNPFRIRAAEYLESRKLSMGNLMICTSGDFANRIIIPYYSAEGELIYFNGRDISGKSKLRYRGPDKTTGVGKSDVLWMSNWPKIGSKVYITEGEFDAMVLHHCGMYSGACGGKSLSAKQLEMLRGYHVVISFDSDKAGKDGLKIAAGLIKEGIRNVGYVRPPVGYKDWNDLLIKTSENLIRAYINKNENTVNDYIFNSLSLFKDV